MDLRYINNLIQQARQETADIGYVAAAITLQEAQVYALLELVDAVDRLNKDRLT